MVTWDSVVEMGLFLTRNQNSGFSGSAQVLYGISGRCRMNRSFQESWPEHLNRRGRVWQENIHDTRSPFITNTPWATVFTNGVWKRTGCSSLFAASHTPVPDLIELLLSPSETDKAGVFWGCQWVVMVITSHLHTTWHFELRTPKF